jgi:two-component system, sensor histidine kinase and response regulator
VINDILDFSKIEAGKLTIDTVPFDLQTVLEEVSDLLAARAFEKRLEFACLLGPGVPRGVAGDPSRVRQILVNLVGNAIKFTESGEVVIEAHLVAEAESHVRIRISVRDTGIGIPPSRLGAIFESFTQADGSTTRKYGGTGLGLSISRHLAQLMGGDVLAESTPGEGSCFSLELGFQCAPQAVRSQGELPMNLEGRRVLIIDDHPVNRRALRGQLLSWGIEPIEVDGGAAALALLRNDATGRLPDLALVDMQMPEMDGEQTAARFKADSRLASIPLVLLSSTGMTYPTPEKMRIRGFAAALIKPVRASRLFNTVAEVLGEAPAPVRAKREAQAATSGARLRPGLRLLLAEDNLVNQKVAVRLLTKWKCEVDAVLDGVEAVAAWERGTYDAILMDVQMPRLDGYQATSRIRALETSRGVRTPIIAMTANAMQGDDQRCFDAGMDDYVPKPVKPEMLEAALVRCGCGFAEGDTRAILDTDRLSEFCGVDAHFRQNVLRDFLDLAPGLLGRIESALERRDPQAMKSASEALRGGAETLGGIALGAACRELASPDALRSLDAARTMLARAQREFMRLKLALAPYLLDASPSSDAA